MRQRIALWVSTWRIVGWGYKMIHKISDAIQLEAEIKASVERFWGTWATEEYGYQDLSYLPMNFVRGDVHAVTVYQSAAAEWGRKVAARLAKTYELTPERELEVRREFSTRLYNDWMLRVHQRCQKPRQSFYNYV